MDPAYNPAYAIGRAVGGFFVFAVLFAFFAGYSIALYKYARSRHAAWLVTAIVLGLPWVLFLGVMLIAACLVPFLPNRGTPAALAMAPPSSETHRKEAVDLISEKFEPVTGTNFDYTIEVPSLTSWKVKSGDSAYDKLFIYRDLYIGVIAERVGVGDAESAHKMAEDNIAAGSSTHRDIGESRSVTIGGRPWVTFDVQADVQRMHLQYRYYVYSDLNRTVQIMAWGSPVVLNDNAYLIDQVAHSFRFGKD